MSILTIDYRWIEKAVSMDAATFTVPGLMAFGAVVVMAVWAGGKLFGGKQPPRRRGR
jgi:hypothetical protein